MRPYLFLLTLCFCKFVSGQTQTEIARLRVYRIDKTIQLLNRPALFTIYYDSTGRVIKEIEKCDYDSSVTTTETQYLTDSLISRLSVDTIVGTEHLGTTVITHEYKFDDRKRVIENTATSSTGEETKEIYIYNNLDKVDTAFVYNNDTTIWANHLYVGQKQLKQTLSLKRIRKYFYESDKVIVEDCCYSNVLSCCETTETINNDTLDVYSNKSLGMQGDVLDSAETVFTYKTHKKNGLAYYIEEATGDKSYSTFKLNQYGLVIRCISKIVSQDGKKRYSTTNYKYYYRQ